MRKGKREQQCVKLSNPRSIAGVFVVAVACCIMCCSTPWWFPTKAMTAGASASATVATWEPSVAGPLTTGPLSRRFTSDFAVLPAASAAAMTYEQAAALCAGVASAPPSSDESGGGGHPARIGYNSTGIAAWPATFIDLFQLFVHVMALTPSPPPHAWLGGVISSSGSANWTDGRLRGQALNIQSTGCSILNVFDGKRDCFPIAALQFPPPISVIQAQIQQLIFVNVAITLQNRPGSVAVSSHILCERSPCNAAIDCSSDTTILEGGGWPEGTRAEGYYPHCRCIPPSTTATVSASNSLISSDPTLTAAALTVSGTPTLRITSSGSSLPMSRSVTATSTIAAHRTRTATDSMSPPYSFSQTENAITPSTGGALVPLTTAALVVTTTDTAIITTPTDGGATAAGVTTTTSPPSFTTTTIEPSTTTTISDTTITSTSISAGGGAPTDAVSTSAPSATATTGTGTPGSSGTERPPSGAGETTTTVGILSGVTSPISGADALSSIQLLAIFAVMTCGVPGAGNREGMSAFLTPVDIGGRFGKLVGQVVLLVALCAVYVAVLAILTRVVGWERARRLLRHPRFLPLVVVLAYPGVTFESAMLAYGLGTSATAAERSVGVLGLLACVLLLGAYYGLTHHWNRAEPVAASAVVYPPSTLATLPAPVRVLLAPRSFWPDPVILSGRCVYASLRPERARVAVGHSLVRILLVSVVCAVFPASQHWCQGILAVAAAVCLAHACFILVTFCYRIPVMNATQAFQSAAVGAVALSKSVDGSPASMPAVTALVVVAFSLLNMCLTCAVFALERCVLVPAAAASSPRLRRNNDDDDHHNNRAADAEEEEGPEEMKAVVEKKAATTCEFENDDGLAEAVTMIVVTGPDGGGSTGGSSAPTSARGGGGKATPRRRRSSSTGHQKHPQNEHRHHSDHRNAINTKTAAEKKYTDLHATMNDFLVDDVADDDCVSHRDGGDDHHHDHHRHSNADDRCQKYAKSSASRDHEGEGADDDDDDDAVYSVAVASVSEESLGGCLTARSNHNNTNTNYNINNNSFGHHHMNENMVGYLSPYNNSSCDPPPPPPSSSSRPLPYASSGTHCLTDRTAVAAAGGSGGGYHRVPSASTTSSSLLLPNPTATTNLVSVPSFRRRQQRLCFLSPEDNNNQYDKGNYGGSTSGSCHTSGGGTTTSLQQQVPTLQVPVMHSNNCDSAAPVPMPSFFSPQSTPRMVIHPPPQIGVAKTTTNTAAAASEREREGGGEGLLGFAGASLGASFGDTVRTFYRSVTTTGGDRDHHQGEGKRDWEDDHHTHDDDDDHTSQSTARGAGGGGGVVLPFFGLNQCTLPSANQDTGGGGGYGSQYSSRQSSSSSKARHYAAY